MKSKKIIAMIVAFAAFMAVATSGLAAVTTQTTYVTGTDKVSVKAVVDGAESGKEVTYLVKDTTDGEILYIDQKTATDGTATFEYKITKSKFEALSTSVSLGTDGTALEQTGKELVFGDVTVVSDAGVSDVTFHSDASCETAAVANTLGTEDEVYAKVELVSGYEIDSVTIGTEVQDNSGKYLVKKGDTLKIVTKLSYVEPKVEAATDIINSLPAADEKYNDTEKYVVNNFAIRVTTGAPTKVGVLVGGTDFYPALTIDNAPYNTTDVYAVRIITAKGETVTGEVVCE